MILKTKPKGSAPEFVSTVTGTIIDLPIGVIIPCFSKVPPVDFLECNGQLLSRSSPAHQGLFDVIGYRYGGSEDKFHVPDLRGKSMMFVIRYKKEKENDIKNQQ